MQDGGPGAQGARCQAVRSSSASERELGAGSGQRARKVPGVAALLWKRRRILSLRNASLRRQLVYVCVSDDRSWPHRGGPQTQRNGGEGKRGRGRKARLPRQKPRPTCSRVAITKNKENATRCQSNSMRGPATRSLLHAAARPSG